MKPEVPSNYPYGVVWPLNKDARDRGDDAPPDETGEPEGLDEPKHDPDGHRSSQVARTEMSETFSDEYEDELNEAEEEGGTPGDPALSPEDRTLIKAIVDGRTHKEAGALIGRSAKYVQRRRADPAFAAALERERTKHNKRLQSLLGPGRIRALEALLRLTASERDADSIKACAVILRYDVQYRTLEGRRELERRVAEIESVLAVEEAIEDEARERGRG